MDKTFFDVSDSRFVDGLPLLIYLMAVILRAHPNVRGERPWNNLEEAFAARIKTVDWQAICFLEGSKLTENALLLREADAFFYFSDRWMKNHVFSKAYGAVSIMIRLDVALCDGLRPWKVFKSQLSLFHKLGLPRAS
jgi:hypothetical protein